jgi:hypothetical protein
MLAASMSKDKYMPRMFTVRGDRLGYSNSIGKAVNPVLAANTKIITVVACTK